MPNYNYLVEGTNAHGSSWKTEGTVSVATAGQFSDVLNHVLLETFQKLTQGKAIYGEGCQGPYSLKLFTLQMVP